jgi:hypothetical protein
MRWFLYWSSPFAGEMARKIADAPNLIGLLVEM